MEVPSLGSQDWMPMLFEYKVDVFSPLRMLLKFRFLCCQYKFSCKTQKSIVRHLFHRVNIAIPMQR